MILIRIRRVLGFPFFFLSQRPPNTFYYKTFFSSHEKQCTPCYCSVRANVQYSFKTIFISRWGCDARDQNVLAAYGHIWLSLLFLHTFILTVLSYPLCVWIACDNHRTIIMKEKCILYVIELGRLGNSFRAIAHLYVQLNECGFTSVAIKCTKWQMANATWKWNESMNMSWDMRCHWNLWINWNFESNWLYTLILF